ncbi:MAG: hypothetical protein AABW67_05990 [Nanoarchaeota archaeon]
MAKKKIKGLEQLSLNFDDPTAEETAEHQRMAEEPQRMAEDSQYMDRNNQHLKQVRIRVYNNFLNEVELREISFKKTEDANLKREILDKYFPGRYKNQGINEYSPEKLNEAFLGFVNYSRKLKRRA